jgi:hypothetical protein
MNEQINELILKAGFHPFVRGEQILFDISTEDNLKEFAELIVTKCAVIATRCESNGNKNIGAEILKHFGVEE